MWSKNGLLLTDSLTFECRLHMHQELSYIYALYIVSLDLSLFIIQYVMKESDSLQDIGMQFTDTITRIKVSSYINFYMNNVQGSTEALWKLRTSKDAV